MTDDRTEELINLIPTHVVDEPPIDIRPGEFAGKVVTLVALTALLEQLGVELGAGDRKLLDWLSGWEFETAAIITSWARRAHAAGAAVGYDTAMEEMHGIKGDGS